MTKAIDMSTGTSLLAGLLSSQSCSIGLVRKEEGQNDKKVMQKCVVAMGGLEMRLAMKARHDG